MDFSSFPPLPLPLNPNLNISGIVANKATLFKSSLMPARLTFLTPDNEEYVAIFKNGDDLRQDQLILQIISLMDQLLRKENLDLKLTPYRALALSSRHGFVQFVDAAGRKSYTIDPQYYLSCYHQELLTFSVQREAY